ncbi:MAG: ABC transporter permease subunit [Verrucomicrobia bacterium]|nr:ABC transporter permease subunit [Verrucomicrobiota bacterium]
MNWALLHNSLLVSGLTTVASVIFGFMGALWLAGLEARLRNGFLAAAAVAFVLPPFLVTNAWLHFLGETGIWRHWLPLNIYSLGGTVWILTLLTWPVTLFLVSSAWRRLDPSQLESDVALQGWPLIRWLLIPLARPALGLASALTFVLALNNFGVPALLQTKVFPAELWVNFNTTFSYWNALYLSWPLLVAPLLLLLWFNRRGDSWPALERPVTPQVFRRQLGKSWLWLSGGSALFLVFVAVLLPLTQLVTAARTWRELLPAFAAGQTAVANSFIFALSAATLCVVLGCVIWRWKAGALLWVPFLLPGVLIGISFIFAFNRPAVALFYGSIWIVIAGLTLRYLAVSWHGVGYAMRSVDRDLIDAAKLSGAGAPQLFRYGYLPQIAPQLAAVWYATYLLCLWDVETLILIVPPGGETLALRTFNLLHYGHNTQVNALCMLLLGLALAPLLAWNGWQWVSSRLPMWRDAVLNSRSAFAQAVILAAIMLHTGCQPTSTNQSPVNSHIFASVQIIGSRGAALGQFNKPRSVAVDATDNLYVVDMTGRVQKFSPDGVFLSSWQMPETDKGRPKGMCRDGSGNVVVIEPHYSRVNHFSTEGKLITQWGVHGTNASQLAFPRSAAVNSRGEIYVSEYGAVERIQKFTADGAEFIQMFGRAGIGAGEFNRPEGLGTDKSDRLYVADSCNHRIQIFSADGRFLRSYGRAGKDRGELSYPYDIRVDSAGRQYVCEFGNSRIQIFDGHDRPLEILGGIGAAPGQFNNPWSLAFDSTGNLYVADAQNHRVQKFIRRNPETRSKKTAPTRQPQVALHSVSLGISGDDFWSADILVRSALQ